MCKMDGGSCHGGGMMGNGPGGMKMRPTWEKVLEYASMPLHGTLSRKLRKGVGLQLNNGDVYEDAVLFLGDEFIRVTVQAADGRHMNTYYDWGKIGSVRTFSAGE